MDEVLFKGSDNAAERIVLFAALVALLIVGIQGAIHARKLNYLLGPAEWKFKESWASTITAAGAILGTALASGAVPKDLEQGQLASFAGLSLLFGVMAVVAPLVYGAITSRKIIDGKPVQLGYVAGFLIACFLTIWAVVGQLGTLLLLLLPEIAQSGSLSANAASAFQLVIVVALALSVVYAFRTIGWAIDDNAQANTEAGQKNMMAPGRRGELEPRSWSLL